MKERQGQRFAIITLIGMLCAMVGAQPIRPLTDRLDAIVSYPLVIAIQVRDERELSRGVSTRLDDGRTLTSTSFWVGYIPQSSLPTWLTSAGHWQASSYDQIRSTPTELRPPGSWFISVPLPVDAVGQGLWFDQTRYELNWLPDPERSLLEADSAPRTRDFSSFWSTHIDDNALADSAVRDAVEQYHRDPFQNWRARLLLDGLDPNRTRARETLAGTPNSFSPLDEPHSSQSPPQRLLAAIARQQEARWQIILGRIWLIDPEIAERMKLVLLRTVRMDERILPMWTADTTGLARLAHDLLSPFVDDQTRVLRAKAWLDAQPRMLSWIIDDQGQLEAGTERLLPTLGVISLPSVPGDSLLRIDSPSDTPLLSTVPPSQLLAVQIPIDSVSVDPASPMIESTPVTLRIAQQRMQHRLIASPIPAQAPFVRIGPLLNDWNMNALISGRDLERAAVSPVRATLGILRRAHAPDRNAPYTGWQLYLECASPEPGHADDALTVWIGPREQPIAAWRISADGRTESVDARGLIELPSVQTRLRTDRWIVQITLPEGAFDDQGQLMLGLERTDADAVHTAWPRRMIPGQQEPGRLIIIPGRFDGLRHRALP